jgi:hypothetical protein
MLYVLNTYVYLVMDFYVNDDFYEFVKENDILLNSKYKKLCKNIINGSVAFVGKCQVYDIFHIYNAHPDKNERLLKYILNCNSLSKINIKKHIANFIQRSNDDHDIVKKNALHDRINLNQEKTPEPKKINKKEKKVVKKKCESDEESDCESDCVNEAKNLEEKRKTMKRKPAKKAKSDTVDTIKDYNSNYWTFDDITAERIYSMHNDDLRIVQENTIAKRKQSEKLMQKQSKVKKFDEEKLVTSNDDPVLNDDCNDDEELEIDFGYVCIQDDNTLKYDSFYGSEKSKMSNKYLRGQRFQLEKLNKELVEENKKLSKKLYNLRINEHVLLVKQRGPNVMDDHYEYLKAEIYLLEKEVNKLKMVNERLYNINIQYDRDVHEYHSRITEDW